MSMWSTVIQEIHLHLTCAAIVLHLTCAACSLKNKRLININNKLSLGPRETIDNNNLLLYYLLLLGPALLWLDFVEHLNNYTISYVCRSIEVSLKSLSVFNYNNITVH